MNKRKRIEYTEAEFQDAYKKWVDTQVEGVGYFSQYILRNAAWDHYCDIRDGLTFGTSRNLRTRREERALSVQSETHVH
jgi:hypothetical protein